ncbi:MAG: HEAT repeat domain-containing protein, partial [Nitrospinales bacterium]
EKFWGVSNRIASALGKIGGKQARDGLLKGLKNDHPKIRYGIVKALGQFLHDEKAAAALRKAAEGDASYRVEAAAFQALGKIKEKKLRVFLESSLDRPSHNDMGRLAIFQALAELEDEASWDAIVQGAKYGAPKNSRMAAMRSMAKLVKRYEHKKGEAIELLKGFVKETHGTPASAFRGKLGAIQAMEILEDLATVPVLRELADRESDGRIQRRAQETISNLFDAAKKPKELKEIRSELDDITKDNKSLRDRLNLLEKKDEAKSKQKKKGK